MQLKEIELREDFELFFLKHSTHLKNGTYNFVAKQSIIEIPYSNLEKDFEKVISRSQAFKEKIA